jgi:hypothetical protein
VPQKLHRDDIKLNFHGRLEREKARETQRERDGKTDRHKDRERQTESKGERDRKRLMGE